MWGSSVTAVRSYLSMKGLLSLIDETDIPSSYLPEVCWFVNLTALSTFTHVQSKPFLSLLLL